MNSARASRPRLLAFALVFAAASPALAEPEVVVWPSIGTRGKVVIEGKVLQSRVAPSPNALTRTINRLSDRGWRFAAVEVRGLGQTASSSADMYGHFSITLEPGTGKRFPPGLARMEAKVRGAVGSAVVQVVDDEAPFIVVASTLALVVDGAPRAGMAEVLRCLYDSPQGRPGLVLGTGAPAELTPELKRTLFSHGFPPLAVALQDLRNPSDGSRLDAVLARLPFPVLFIGNEGPLFTRLSQAWPERVVATYLLPPPSQAGSDGTPVSSATALAKDLEARGFISKTCGAVESSPGASP